MTKPVLSPARIRQLLARARDSRLLVIGDVMLDQFIWGSVARISPEAPVPVVDFERENFMPGGAANVARNLSSLGAAPELLGVVGNDPAAQDLRKLLREHKIGCAGLLTAGNRRTCVKTRVVAHTQQVVRIDRETREDIDPGALKRLLKAMSEDIKAAPAVIIGDYGKGVITQALLDEAKRLCRERAVWLSLDPKPVHHLELTGLSLITPNRKETFELAGLPDTTRSPNPLTDANLLAATRLLMQKLAPAVLLVTLGELGMLLCQREAQPHHIPTVAQEVFDVSGAGDTVIASFTLAIAAGASPLEAALLSNQAAGVVVGKIGTATVAPEELLGL